MNRKPPPALATLLLQRIGPRDDAIVGDLLEGYQSGRSALWYWRQVLAAVVARVQPAHMTRAVIVGWCSLWVFDLITSPADRQFGAASLDWLIVTLGSHPFVMLWAVVLAQRPFEIAGYLLSGWIVAKLHPQSRAVATGAFMVTVLAHSMWRTAMWVMNQQQVYARVAFGGWMVAFAALPVLIVIGGALAGRKDLERAA